MTIQLDEKAINYLNNEIANNLYLTICKSIHSKASKMLKSYILATKTKKHDTSKMLNLKILAPKLQ